MADEATQITAEELEKYPPAMRPVVQRHGPALFQFACAVAGTNRAIGMFGQAAHNLRHLRMPTKVVEVNMTYFCEEIMKLHKWTGPQLQECIQDVGRAHALHQQSATQIIVPGSDQVN